MDTGIDTDPPFQDLGKSDFHVLWNHGSIQHNALSIDSLNPMNLELTYFDPANAFYSCLPKCGYVYPYPLLSCSLSHEQVNNLLFMPFFHQ